MATKAQGIGGDTVDFTCYRLVGNVVQVTACFQVGVFQIDGGRIEALVHGLYADNGLDGTSGTNTVTSHTLGGRNLHLVGVITKGQLYHLCF